MIDYKEEWLTRVRDFSSLGAKATQGMVLHALVTSGSCTFEYNTAEIHAGAGCAIITRGQELISRLRTTDDFAVEGFFITNDYIELSGQEISYSVRHILLVNANPVMKLSEDEQKRWLYDLENIFSQTSQTDNPFRTESVFTATWQFILDCFRISARIYGNPDTTLQMSALAANFFKMLEAGEYRTHRDIPYYAGQLLVSPKHLSETVKKVSGHSANYWITHFTLIGLRRLLRNHNLSLGEIADMYGFSSAAYFTRYLQIHLGMNPSKLRG